MANVPIIMEDFDNHIIKDLTAKLFYICEEYSGNATERNQLRNRSLAGGSLYNSIVFLPNSNEILVNGNFYGASTEFVEKLGEVLTDLTGQDVNIDGAWFKGYHITENNSKIGEFVKWYVQREIGVALDNVEITSGIETGDNQITNLSSKEGYIQVTRKTKSTAASTKPAIVDGAGNELEAAATDPDTTDARFDVRIPLDGITIVNDMTGPNMLRSTVRAYYMPKGSVYVLDGVSKTIENASIYLIAENANVIINNGHIDTLKSENILSIIDATDFVKDSLVDSEKTGYDEKTHKLTIVFKDNDNSNGSNGDSAENAIVIDFAELVDIDLVEVADGTDVENHGVDSRDYLVVKTDTDAEADGEHPTKVYLSTKVASESDIIDRMAALQRGGDDNHWLVETEKNIGLADAQAVAKIVKTTTSNLSKAIQDETKAREDADKDINDAIEAEATRAGDEETRIEKKFDDAIAALDFEETDKTTAAKDNLNNYLTYEVKQEDGLLTKAAFDINVVKIADAANDGVIKLDDVNPGLADASDVAKVIEGVEQALEEWVTGQINALIDSINDWAKNGAWDTTTVAGA